jgi:hypothetical protein
MKRKTKKMKAALMRPNNSRSSEHGNVFLFILLGVVLFAALAFVMSRGFRSDTTSAMSQRQAELIAVDILSYGQRLERAVANLQRKGISENDISFDNGAIAGYGHTPAEDNNQKVFHPAGGAATWKEPPSSANDGSPWHFTGNTCITDIGTGAIGCSANSNATDEDLIAVLPSVNPSICNALNRKLGIATMPTNGGAAYSSTQFTGNFGDGSEINLGTKYNAACYEDGGDYDFYFVLIAR